jgi:catechol 2,3-dioxygenase
VLNFPSDKFRPMEGQPLDIGHVHLRVSDIHRALAFYRDILGFEVVMRIGEEAAFLSSGDYHHRIALNTWQSRGGGPPSPGSTGLHHAAVRFPTRNALAHAVRRCVDQGVTITGAADEGFAEAVWVSDPDENGIELCWDRPPREWPRSQDGRPSLPRPEPMDIEDLLALTR